VKRCQWLLLFFIILCHPLRSSAQAWSGILDPSRAIDWSVSGLGIPGGIPNRTTNCATLNPGATSSQIDSAIASCPSGQVVFLNAGTYLLSSGITFNGHSNVTLRGAGPTLTILVFTGGDSCGGQGGDVCLIDSVHYYDGSAAVQPGGSNAAHWTGGYAQGTTQITLDKAPPVGHFVILDQANDTSDTGGLLICDITGPCRTNGGGNNDGRVIGGVTYSQAQVVTATAVSGSGPYTVTISPGLYANNWRAAKNPGAWWPGQVNSIGVENLTVDHSASSAKSGIYFYDCYQCWARNVKSLNGNRNHVWITTSAHVIVRDSFFYGTHNAAQLSYGVEPLESSDALIENNIFDGIASPLLIANGAGSVVAYNFSVHNLYNVSPTWMQVSLYSHNAGNHMGLFEGNQFNGISCDNAWGTGALGTFFRNQLFGWEAGKSLETNTFELVSNSCRAMNIIGNVLGTKNYHNNYEASPTAGSSNCNTSIYQIGWASSQCRSGSGNDSLTISTMLRWGNYDVAHASAQWNASEIPTTGVPFINGNPVPATHTLPSSFYLTTKPIWWGPMPWPAIGPDVTGGTGPDGHAYAIPAQACYNNTAKDGGGILLFDANACYYSQQRPAPPTNLKSVVN